MTIAEVGDNIVTTSTLYGGTLQSVRAYPAAFRYRRRFADYRDIDAMGPLIDGKTKAVFLRIHRQSCGERGGFRRLGRRRPRPGRTADRGQHRADPYLCRPFEHGADIVVHSLTKYMGGHGTSLGGIIVDSGHFPWDQHKTRFARLNEPDPSYHGVVYVEALGPAAFIGRARWYRCAPGAAISPFNSFLILQGIENCRCGWTATARTPSRPPNICATIRKVTWIKYPALADSPENRWSTNTWADVAPASPRFGIKGRPRSRRQIHRRAATGDPAGQHRRCQVTGLPSSDNHPWQLSPDELARAGVSEDLVRLSIGIEHIDATSADLEQPLAAAK